MTSTNSSVAACVALLKAIAPAAYESLASTPFAVDDDDHSHSHGGDDDHGHDHGHGDDDHGHDHDHDHDHSHGGHGHSHGFCEGLEGLYSVGLHVGAIFVVLVASAVGAMLPILGKRVRALRIPPYVYSVGKCTATGVMLSVAMIHMINHASLAFAEECVPESFAERFEGWAFLFAMIAAILMHAVDVAVADIAEGWAFRRSECAAAAADVAAASEPSETPLVCCGEGDDHHHHKMTEPDAVGINDDERSCHHEKCGTVCLEEPADGAVAVTISPMETDCCDAPAGAACVGHQHGVAVPEDMGAVQRVVAAACMEFGVTLHSVFVGLALGVTSDSDLKVLLVALVFHQLFEGLAMGARLAEAGFHLSLEIVLMVVFALSAPIGISAGTIAVSVSRTALAGTTYVMVSAVLDSVCGGILLYLAFNLLFVDFPADMRAHCGRDAPHRVWRKLGLLAGLWFGAGVLAFIGKWL